jgi:glycosyltransferase involved in cell wall biosynthesis
MKVLQVVSSLSAGGAEGVVADLSVSLAQAGIDVRVYTLAGIQGNRGAVLLNRLREAGVSVHGVRERRAASPRNFIDLVTLLNSWKPDIVHAHLYASEVACALTKLIPLRIRTSYVRTLHSSAFWGYRSHTVLRLLDRFYEITIGCTPTALDAYRGFMKDQWRSTLVSIPNGATMLERVPAPFEKRLARASLGLPEEAFVVVHVGRMAGGADSLGERLETSYKAHDVLVQAFAQAFGGELNSHLVLVGDGSLRPAVEALVRELRIEAQVLFLGQQPEPWLALKTADAFCFPSRLEGLSIALLEAGSCGLPVVASDIPEIRFLSPGEGWLLVPVNDVEQFAHGLRTVREQLRYFTEKARSAAQDFREGFSREACSAKHLQVYQSLVSNSR